MRRDLSRSILLLLTMLVLPVFLTGCPEKIDDKDNSQPEAKMIIVGMLTKGPDINATDQEDPVDWKYFEYFKNGKASVTFLVGELGAVLDMVGDITLFDFYGNIISQQVIEPSKRAYIFEFEVEPKKRYFFKFNVKKGKAPYMIESKVEPIIIDPCAECGDDEKCVDGKCFPADVCEPECEGDDVCVAGECKPPCDGGCGKGYYCSKKANKCLKNLCYGKKCPSGQKCKGVSGNCVAVKATPPPSKPKCPPCKGNEYCSKKTNYECVAKKDLTAYVVMFMGKGGGTHLSLNKGSKHGVKVGMSGTFKGGSFKITKVYPYRAEATSSSPPGTFKTNMKVSIKLN